MGLKSGGREFGIGTVTKNIKMAPPITTIGMPLVFNNQAQLGRFRLNSFFKR